MKLESIFSLLMICLVVNDIYTGRFTRRKLDEYQDEEDEDDVDDDF